MKQKTVTAEGIRFSAERGGIEVGHAHLYLLTNDLHDKPFGLLEDVFVEPDFRGAGIANELLVAVLNKAREHCYKLIATSRNDGTRTEIHNWYARLGFAKYGTEFRMDF